MAERDAELFQIGLSQVRQDVGVNVTFAEPLLVPLQPHSRSQAAMSTPPPAMVIACSYQVTDRRPSIVPCHYFPTGHDTLIFRPL